MFMVMRVFMLFYARFMLMIVLVIMDMGVSRMFMHVFVLRESMRMAMLMLDCRMDMLVIMYHLIFPPFRYSFCCACIASL